MSESPRAIYCWFDTEYTGLDLDRAELLEVALIVTNESLVPIGTKPMGIPLELLTEDGLCATLTTPPRSRISRHVLENYQALLERCDREGRTLAEVDSYLARYLDQFDGANSKDPSDRPILAGNSIFSDYFLARRYLPKFAQRLHYRRLDVSSFKLEWLHFYQGKPFRKTGNAQLISQFYPGKDPITGDKHDAYFDIQASIAELAFYRSQLSPPRS